MKFLIIAVAMFASIAKANEVQNGGGGICIQDRCMTLAEAGLRIVREKKPNFQPPADLIKEIDKVMALIPLANANKEKLMTRIMGNFDTFVKVEQADPQKFEQTKRAYIEIIKQANTSIKPEDFVLFAASEAKVLTQDKKIEEYKTYLLPEFFKSSLRSQALTMIHEALVRGQEYNILPLVVEFDGLLLNFINRNGQFKMEDIDLMIVMRDLQLYGVTLEYGRIVRNDYERLNHMLFAIEKILKRPLIMNEIFGSHETVVNKVYGADRRSLLLSQSFFPLMPELFDGLRVRVEWGSNSNGIAEFAAGFCKGKVGSNWYLTSDLGKSIHFIKCFPENKNEFREIMGVTAPRL